ncbi:MAG: cellulase family glycosylhydrolase, partial [Woeseiaceae bacterium]
MPQFTSTMRRGILQAASILLCWPALSLAQYSIDFESQGSTSLFTAADWQGYGVADVGFVGGTARGAIDNSVAHSGRRSLRVSFPAGSVGPSEGGYQAAIRLEPADEYTLSYWLKFDPDFSWGSTQQGGKLPGLAQGDLCSGGAVCDGSNGFTARYMWRKNGAAVLYLYHMDKPGKWGEDFALQTPAGEPYMFPRGEWIRLVQRVKINSPGKADGKVRVWVNGSEALSLDGLRFVSDDSRIDTFYVSTFHGGNTPDWGPAHDSYLWIDDIEIDRGGDGSPLVLGKGTNLAHWLSQTTRRGEERRRFITADDIAYIARLGFDHVRLPIDEEHMWDEDGNRDDEAFAIMLDAVRWSLAHDLRILIDLHILRSHHFNAADKPLWTDLGAQQRFIALWQDLSSALHEFPNDSVAYELMNEPVADDPEDWNQLLAKVFAAVRELEPDRTIVIGSNRWQSVDTFDQLRVPDDRNVILSYHFYEPFLLTHYDTGWTFLDGYAGPVHYPGIILTEADFESLPDDQKEAVAGYVGKEFNREVLVEMMAKPLRVARQLGLPLYCGEYGVFDRAPRDDRLRWYRDMRAIFDEHGVSWANW